MKRRVRAPGAGSSRHRAERGGFTLAEVLVAMAVALVLTAATASALTGVLRGERSQWALRRAACASGSWVADRYAGEADHGAMDLRRVELEEKDAPWRWLGAESPAAAAARVTVWVREPTGVSAR